MGILETAIDWLQAQRHEHLTVTVVYTRGAHSVTLAATRGNSEFGEMADESGAFQIGFQTRDFIFRKADLVLNNVAVEPKRGDLIDDGGKRWVVTAPSGTPVYRYSDHAQTTLRIYTRVQGDTP